MTDKFEVSFNSPQCGWMSVGFGVGEKEFHTTTAHAPHETVLCDLLKTLSDLLESDGDFETVLTWNRDPEAYDLVFRRRGEQTLFEICEYPTEAREKTESELVFSHEGVTRDICRAFYQTFQQLYDERVSDEFEQNWHRPFPVGEFEIFKQKLD